MTVRIGVVVFPGSNCDRDTLRGLELAGAEAVELWHEQGSLDGVAAVVLPGGFAYGDYVRAGVIARFSPVMRAISAFAADGGLVLGICNGFQVLAEAGLVPGALLRNRGLRFLVRYVRADGSVAGDEADSANPNGSLHAIAGVLNARGNVAGLMPHPERAADALLGSDDGLPILRSLVEAASRAAGGSRELVGAAGRAPVAVGRG